MLLNVYLDNLTIRKIQVSSCHKIHQSQGYAFFPLPNMLPAVAERYSYVMHLDIYLDNLAIF